MMLLWKTKRTWNYLPDPFQFSKFVQKFSFSDDQLSDQFQCFNSTPDTAWKVSVFGVILVRMRESPDQNNSKYDQFYAV